jgi:hypothetical protein
MGPLILQSSLIFLSYGVESDMAGGGGGPRFIAGQRHRRCGSVQVLHLHYPGTNLASFDQMISCRRYLAFLVVRLDIRDSSLPDD